LREQVVSIFSKPAKRGRIARGVSTRQYLPRPERSGGQGLFVEALGRAWRSGFGLSLHFFSGHMDANKRSLGQIFDPSIRLVVPLFQRPYVWNQEKNWEPLWQTIKEDMQVVVIDLNESDDAQVISRR
jgi:hypothetical protein